MRRTYSICLGGAGDHIKLINAQKGALIDGRTIITVAERMRKTISTIAPQASQYLGFTNSFPNPLGVHFGAIHCADRLSSPAHLLETESKVGAVLSIIFSE